MEEDVKMIEMEIRRLRRVNELLEQDQKYILDKLQFGVDRQLSSDIAEQLLKAFGR